MATSTVIRFIQVNRQTGQRRSVWVASVSFKPGDGCQPADLRAALLKAVL